MKAIDIIHAEHRALGAVVQAFRHVLDGIHGGTKQPDFVLLDALIEYITQAPDKLHHPKEDAKTLGPALPASSVRCFRKL